jgi:hypothetical protein
MLDMPLEAGHETAEARQDVALASPQPGAVSAVVDEAAGFMAILERMATNPAVDPQKMQAVLDVHERILNKRSLAEFNQAFARLAGKMPRIKRDGSVSYADKQGNKTEAFKFARWEDIMASIQPDLVAEGFALTFKAAPRTGDGGGLLVTGRLLHAGGHSEEATIPLPLDMSGGKNNLQGYGSTFSYGKRYTATMLLNIVTEGEDDDANATLQFITDKQLAELRALIDEVQPDLDKFCEYLKVKALPDLPYKQFDKAKNALLAKRAKGAKP